jgi:hypothetical protein
VVNIPWPCIQPVDLDEAIGNPRRSLARRDVKRRSAQFGGLRAEEDFGRRRLLLQLGGNVHCRAGNIKAINCIATAFAQTDQAGMNPDAKIDRMPSRSGRSAMTLNVPGRDARAIRMILVRAWPAKYGNTTVARIVDDLSPDTFRRITDVIQPVVQERLSLVRIASRDMAS